MALIEVNQNRLLRNFGSAHSKFFWKFRIRGGFCRGVLGASAAKETGIPRSSLLELSYKQFHCSVEFNPMPNPVWPNRDLLRLRRRLHDGPHRMTDTGPHRVHVLAACLLAEGLLQWKYLGTTDNPGNSAAVFFLFLYLSALGFAVFKLSQ